MDLEKQELFLFMFVTENGPIITGSAARYEDTERVNCSGICRNGEKSVYTVALPPKKSA